MFEREKKVENMTILDETINRKQKKNHIKYHIITVRHTCLKMLTKQNHDFVK